MMIVFGSITHTATEIMETVGFIQLTTMTNLKITGNV